MYTTMGGSDHYEGSSSRLDTIDRQTTNVYSTDYLEKLTTTAIDNHLTSTTYTSFVTAGITADNIFTIDTVTDNKGRITFYSILGIGLSLVLSIIITVPIVLCKRRGRFGYNNDSSNTLITYSFDDIPMRNIYNPSYTGDQQDTDI